ncbi:Hypothetical predicted protein [Olea europaea subsp. europaea]|uniref:Uncharacterized protein n=1 Tax=Olea europaea subsp. europaea TaxID=158383 RepID=A0A8S0T368_OLEEU|nr:Hypothetical predicted protein [Olea europaea subsp. europaea]
MEMVQPCMDSVLYNKPQQPSLSRHSRSSKINRTMKKSKPHILMITDGRLGHLSDIEIDDDDDDFVDPPLRRQRTSLPDHSSMDPPMEPDKMYVESPKDEGASAHMSPPHAAYTTNFEGENVDASVDRKGKGKMYPDMQTFDPMNLKLPSFDLEIGCTQPT